MVLSQRRGGGVGTGRTLEDFETGFSGRKVRRYHHAVDARQAGVFRVDGQRLIALVIVPGAIDVGDERCDFDLTGSFRDGAAHGAVIKDVHTVADGRVKNRVQLFLAVAGVAIPKETVLNN